MLNRKPNLSAFSYEYRVPHESRMSAAKNKYFTPYSIFVRQVTI